MSCGKLNVSEEVLTKLFAVALGRQATRRCFHRPNFMSRDGASLVVEWNGQFRGRDESLPGTREWSSHGGRSTGAVRIGPWGRVRGGIVA